MCERMMQQEKTFHAFSWANVQLSASDEASLFSTPAATLMFGINEAPSSMIRNKWQPTEKGLFRMATQTFLLTLALSLCVHRSHTLSNHAFAQSEEGQLPAAPAHYGLRRASAVQQHRGQSSGVCLQEEQDALQLGQLPPKRSSYASRHVPSPASQ